MENKGVLLGSRESDWVAGVSSKMEYKVELPSGDWTPFLPLEEWQWHTIGFDTMACVTFSATSVIETILNHKLHTGQMSDTTIQRMIDLGYIHKKP